MPRHEPKSGAKRAHQERDPRLTYDHLPLAKQIACYNFNRHLSTNGGEGWDPSDKPGSIFHWRSSNYIRENIKQSSWRKIAERMSLLARDLHHRNILLEDPFEEHRNKRVELQAAAEVVEAVVVDQEEDKEEASYDSYPSPPETESEEEDLTPMPTRRLHSSNKKPRASDEDGLCSTMSAMKIGKDTLIGAVAFRPCARPMLPTYWEDWDEELCDSVGYAKIVISLDPTTELDDLRLSFVDKRHFKIGIRWPPYLSNYFSLAEMDKDSTGKLLFPRRHASEIGFGKNTNKLKDENGEIFDYSIVFFPGGKDMDTSVYEPKILHGKTKDKKGNEVPVKLLRIIFHEARKSGASKRIEIEESQDNTDLCKLGEKKNEAASPQASLSMDVDSDEEEDDNNTSSSTPVPTPFQGTASFFQTQTPAGAVDPATIPLPGSPCAGRIRPRDEFVAPRSGKKAKPTNAIVPLPSSSPSSQDY